MAADTSEQDLPGLLRLPLEIMEVIAQELPEDNLLSLRLVCRDIESKTLRIYTKVFFSEKSFWPFSKLSMEDLGSLCKHPHFSKSVEKIRFVLQFVPFQQLSGNWSTLAKKMKAGS